jgi:hypothetical protein
MFMLGKNRVDTDEGFTIEFDRMRMWYVDSTRRIRINHEMGPGKRMIAIWPSYTQELNAELDLTAEDCDRIVGNIKRALQAVGYDLTVA